VRLNLQSIESQLALKCLGELINIIQNIILNNKHLVSNFSKANIIKRIFDYVEMICELSIRNELKRGESSE